MNTLKPWDAQPNEAPKMFERFRAFLALGPTRTIKKAADSLNSPLSTIKTTSKKFGWVARAKAWDEHMARVQNKARESEATKAGRRAERLAQRLATVALGETQKLAELSAKSDELVVSPREVVKMSEVAFKASRLVAGKATEQVEATEAGPDLGVLTDDELRQYDRLARKAAGLPPID